MCSNKITKDIKESYCDSFQYYPTASTMTAVRESPRRHGHSILPEAGRERGPAVARQAPLCSADGIQFAMR